MSPTGNEKKRNDDVVIDMEDESDERLSMNEKVCRICEESSHHLMKLGCDCRGDIAFIHPNCVANWFSHEGNKYVFIFLFIFFFNKKGFIVFS